MSHGRGIETLQLSTRVLKSRILTTWQWLTLVGFIVSATAGCLVYAYTNFELKVDHNADESRFDQRLARIENKLDQLLLRGK